MTLKKNKFLLFSLALIIIITGIWFFRHSQMKKQSNGYIMEEIHPVIGDITDTISTTGIVEPRNRLEIKPAINGRIEEILVKEGDHVQQGQIVARMSSTERAALLDAARGQGESAMDYWLGVYKATPLMSPIDGEVIVRSIEPGQTVTTQDAVIVLSDRLIVNAQVDETDIGLVRTGQKAVITLDAYQETNIPGAVDHIAYESTIINNITVYEVVVLPETVPGFFRSGMSANVEVTVNEKQNVLLLPVESLVEHNGRKTVLAKLTAGKPPVETEVTVGLSNTEQVEIITGIDELTTVVIRRQKYAIPEEETGNNPFSPFGSRKKKK